MGYGTHDFRHLKSHVRIEEVLSREGLLEKFTRSGDRLTGPCPLHRGDNRHAFVISRSRNLWYCFTGCSGSHGRNGGDVIDFVRLLHGFSYRQSAEYLVSMSSMSEKALAQSSLACQSASRASSGEAFRPFRQRLSLDPNAPFLKAKGITPSLATEYEVGAWPAAGWLKGCIGVRLFDPLGSPLGYAGRRLEEAEIEAYGKWKVARQLALGELLYNYHRVSGRLCHGLYVVECAWGVLRLAQIGVPAVALFGLELTQTRVELLRRARVVTLLLDGDRAGREASVRLAQRLAPVVRVRIATLPWGRDPDDLEAGELRQLVTEHGACLPQGSQEELAA